MLILKERCQSILLALKINQVLIFHLIFLAVFQNLAGATCNEYSQTASFFRSGIRWGGPGNHRPYSGNVAYFISPALLRLRVHEAQFIRTP